MRRLRTFAAALAALAGLAVPAPPAAQAASAGVCTPYGSLAYSQGILPPTWAGITIQSVSINGIFGIGCVGGPSFQVSGWGSAMTSCARESAAMSLSDGNGAFASVQWERVGRIGFYYGSLTHGGTYYVFEGPFVWEPANASATACVLDPVFQANTSGVMPMVGLP